MTVLLSLQMTTLNYKNKWKSYERKTKYQKSYGHIRQKRQKVKDAEITELIHNHKGTTLFRQCVMRLIYCEAYTINRLIKMISNCKKHRMNK